jgi:hypothetical protein
MTAAMNAKIGVLSPRNCAIASDKAAATATQVANCKPLTYCRQFISISARTEQFLQAA